MGGGDSPPGAGGASSVCPMRGDLMPSPAAPSFRTPGKAPWRGAGAAAPLGWQRQNENDNDGSKPFNGGKPFARKLAARSPATASAASGDASNAKYAKRRGGGGRPAAKTPASGGFPRTPGSGHGRKFRAAMAEVTNVDDRADARPHEASVPPSTVMLTPPSSRKTKSRRDGAGAAPSAGSPAPGRGDRRTSAAMEAEDVDRANMPPPPARSPVEVFRNPLHDEVDAERGVDAAGADPGADRAVEPLPRPAVAPAHSWRITSREPPAGDASSPALGLFAGGGGDRTPPMSDWITASGGSALPGSAGSGRGVPVHDPAAVEKEAPPQTAAEHTGFASNTSAVGGAHGVPTTGRGVPSQVTPRTEWARTSRAWHQQQATQLDELKHQLSSLQQAQRMEQLTMEQQQLQLQQQMDDQLRAQREAMEHQRRQMQRAVELARRQAEEAKAEQASVREELARLLEEQEKNNRARIEREEAGRLREGHEAATNEVPSTATNEDVDVRATPAEGPSPPVAVFQASVTAPPTAAPAHTPVVGGAAAVAAVVTAAPVGLPAHPMAHPYSGLEHHQQNLQGRVAPSHPGQGQAPGSEAALGAVPTPLALVAGIEAAAATFSNPGAAAAAASAQRTVEEELRACRRAIQLRNAESEHISRRMRTLQQEEAELHLRAAELQNRMLRMVLEANPDARLDAAFTQVPPFNSYDGFATLGEAAGITGAASSGAVNPGPSVTMATPTSLPAGTVSASPAYIPPAASHDVIGQGQSISDLPSDFEPFEPVGQPVAAGVPRVPVMEVNNTFAAGDDFITMEYSESAAAAAAAAAAAVRDPGVMADDHASGAVAVQAATVEAAAATLEAAAAGAEDAAMSTANAAALGSGLRVGFTPDTGRRAEGDAVGAVASWRRPIQTLALRKSVTSLQFMDVDGDGAGMLMTGTTDGCIRLFSPGARRASAMIRGPKAGLNAAVVVGSEAFCAASGGLGRVECYDLSSGRELGALLAGAGAAGGGGNVELTCIAADGGLVAGAGEGGDVFLWDPRAGSRSEGRWGGGQWGCSPASTFHIAGASRVLSLSLSGCHGGGGNVAVVASNGARVFDLRMSGRPMRLTSREPGQRWVAAGHTPAAEPVTLSTSGDVTIWTSSPPHAPFRTLRGVDKGGGVLAVSRRFTGAPSSLDDAEASITSAADAAAAPGQLGGAGCLVLTSGGTFGETARVSDLATGSVVAEWGADGNQVVYDAGVSGYGAGYPSVGRWADEVEAEEAAAPLTSVAWSAGGHQGEAHGAASFALGTSDGTVRVYGCNLE